MNQPNVIGPRYTREEIADAFPTTVVGTAEVLQFPGTPPAVMANRPASLAAAAKANLPSHWFDALTTEQKNAVLRHIMSHPAIVADADERGHGAWLDGLMALKNAEYVGANEAYDISLEWSQTSKWFRNQADFDKDWNSLKPVKPGGITVGYLLDRANKASVDLSQWRNTSQSNDPTTVVITGAPLTQMPRVMDEAAARIELGARYSLTSRWGGTPSFMRHYEDGSIDRRKPREVQIELAGYYVEIIEKDKTRQLPASTWWVNDPHKRVFDAVIYDPENKFARPGETIFNLWRGFAIEAVRGD